MARNAPRVYYQNYRQNEVGKSQLAEVSPCKHVVITYYTYM